MRVAFATDERQPPPSAELQMHTGASMDRCTARAKRPLPQYGGIPTSASSPAVCSSSRSDVSSTLAAQSLRERGVSVAWQGWRQQHRYGNTAGPTCALRANLHARCCACCIVTRSGPAGSKGAHATSMTPGPLRTSDDDFGLKAPR